MLDAEGRALRAELVDRFRRGVDAPLPDAEFDRLALRVFAYQYERNIPYAAYCRRRGRTPEAVSDWREIPAVPTAAFKEVALVAGSPAAAEAVFRTSGTTLGRERRGRHYLLDLSLYTASLLPNFAAHLAPDGREMPILSLVPPVPQMAESSLACMISVVLERLGSKDSAYYAAVGSGIDTAALDRALREAETAGRPVCLVGTALAFVHWLEDLESDGHPGYDLPAGSRLMDTGGFKGTRREVPQDQLLERYQRWLGIPPDHVVNEYGMTELCSQFYDTVLHDRARERERGPRRKRPPPWVRTLVVDPETLSVVDDDQAGILAHYDLANLGSVIAVQTADLGRRVDDGFVVLGRAAGASPRGCSIAMDVLLEAVADEEVG